MEDQSVGKRCKARSKTTGKQCQRPAVGGKEVCYYHGGAPGSGRPVIHGRYSKALKRSALSDAYRTALEDAALLDLREPLALMEAAVQRSTERSADMDTPEFRQRALELFEAAQAAGRDKDTNGFRENMIRLGELLRQGVDEDKALLHMTTQAERLARRVEAAWQVKLQRKQVLNVQQVGAVLARILDIVTEEVAPAVATVIIHRMEHEVLELPNSPPIQLPSGDTNDG